MEKRKKLSGSVPLPGTLRRGGRFYLSDEGCPRSGRGLDFFKLHRRQI
jgi:hypothetical protein